MEQYFPFEVSELPYSYVGLVPRCDANTLYYHHDKYYAEAVYELNRLVVRHRLTDRSLSQLVSEDFNLPAAQLSRLKSAAGAVYNHQLFFDGIACKAGAPPFNRLTEEHFQSIARIMLEELAASLKEKAITFTYDGALVEQLTHKSYSRTYGARNLRRTIQKELEDPMATRIIDSYETPITQIKATAEDGEVKLYCL